MAFFVSAVTFLLCYQHPERILKWKILRRKVVLSAFWMPCLVPAALQAHGDADTHYADVLVDVTRLNGSESLAFQKVHSNWKGETNPGTH